MSGARFLLIPLLVASGSLAGACATSGGNVISFDDAGSGGSDSGRATGGSGSSSGGSEDGSSSGGSEDGSSNGGSEDGSSNGGDEDGSGSGGNEGGSDGGMESSVGSLPPGCPASPPNANAACTSASPFCQYGADPNLSCDTVAECTLNGARRRRGLVCRPAADLGVPDVQTGRLRMPGLVSHRRPELREPRNVRLPTRALHVRADLSPDGGNNLGVRRPGRRLPRASPRARDAVHRQQRVQLRRLRVPKYGSVSVHLPERHLDVSPHPMPAPVNDRNGTKEEIRRVRRPGRLPEGRWSRCISCRSCRSLGRARDGPQLGPTG